MANTEKQPAVDTSNTWWNVRAEKERKKRAMEDALHMQESVVINHGGPDYHIYGLDVTRAAKKTTRL